MPLQPRSPRPKMRCPSVSTTSLTSRSGQASSRCFTAPYIRCTKHRGCQSSRVLAANDKPLGRT